MSKMRVFELARELKVDTKAVIEILKKHHIDVKNNMSGVDDAGQDVVKKALEGAKPAKKTARQAAAPAAPEAAKQEKTAAEAAPEKKAEEKPEPKKEAAPQPKEEPKKEVKAEVKPEPKKETAAPQPKEEPKKEAKAEKQEQPEKKAEKPAEAENRQQQAPAKNATQNNNQNNQNNRGEQQRKDGQGSRNNGPRENRPNANGNGGNERRQQNDRNNNGGNRQQNQQPAPQPQNNGGNGNGGKRRHDNENGGNQQRGGGKNAAHGNKTNDKGRGRDNKGRNNFNDENNARGPKNFGGKNKGRDNKGRVQQAPQKAEIARPKKIKVGEVIAVKDLASKMSLTAVEIIKKLMLMGVLATINQEIDFDTAALVADSFGVTVEELPPEVDPTEIPVIEDAPQSLVLRPPVVTVMGHVDHGKTSLLDCIRSSSVTSQEAGGITQRIGAYQVNCQGKKIVFLDTPGHEAFTAMRARGAQVTDVAVLVVAADDGVMPQTIEAINHAKSANVPIVVAVNKIDKPGANPEHVKQQLAEHGIVSEEWGGDAIMVPVSAKKQIGIEDLLENILLVAEVAELKANPNREARGVIIEAQLDKGRGPVATVLVQSGTLRIGDSIIAGTTYGKVRAMINDRGDSVKKAGPSTPVEVLGLNAVPAAGDDLAALEEKLARSIAEKRIEHQRNQLINKKKVSLDDLFQQIQEGSIKDLNILIKADGQGSVEAINSSLLGLNKNDEVRVNIIHSGVGAVNESDVMLAAASNALIIAFNVRPDANARKVADAEKIDIRTYQVIYDAINDVKDAMSGMLAPKYKEVIQGRVEIRQVMKFAKLIIAGSYVLEGKITNNSKVRMLRDNIVIYDGEVDTLRRFKDDVKEVATGYECGLTVKDFRDYREGDVLEVYTMEEIATDINDLNQASDRK
ncbi:MAG: translation initiation factor IF-2 [Selenomonadaceae bacterium]|nr:translation initiation factor IF-2 [Selenomonadaceae bacterium]